MSERTAQSKISPIRFPANDGLAVIAEEITGIPQGPIIYTSTKISVTGEKNPDGTPVIRKEIIRYSDAKGSNPVVIAKGSTKDGEAEFEYTSNATKDERKNLIQIKGASVGQANTLKKSLDLKAEEKEEFNKVNSRGGNATEIEAASNRTALANIQSDKKTRNKFPDLIYPEGLGRTKQDVIRFNMLEYSPRKFEGTGFSDRRRISKDKIIGSVTLPIPGGISDKNACVWGESTITAMGAATSGVALGFIKEGTDGAKSAANQVLRDIQGQAGVTQAVASKFAEAATGTSGILARTTGAIINPNLELLFDKPTLRPFQFRFRLSPRNRDEAKEVVKIIRFFKQGSAPIRGQSRIFLKSPHTFQLEYILRGEGDTHPFLNKFKECALTSIAVDYTPEGNYATYENGSMSSYQITMEFKELEPVFNDDYESKFASFRQDPAEQAALQSDIPPQIGF